MFKQWFRRVHLILAILMVFFLINLSISGALLVFGKEIQNNIQPEQWQVKPQVNLLPLSQLISIAETSRGHSVKRIQLAPEKDKAWQFQFDSGEQLSINPFNGEILHRYLEEDSFYGFVMAWHRWLLLRDDSNEKPLKILISITSLLLIIEMIIGLSLWLKPKKRLKRLKINIKAKPRVMYYQLHTVVGVFAFIPLLLIAVSGMAFNWQSQIKWGLETLVAQPVEQIQHPTIADTEQALRLDLAFSHGIKSMGEGELYRIYLPVGDQALKLRVKMPDEFFAYSWVWIHPYTGKVIKTYDASTANLATRIWNFKYTFHIGDFFGTGFKFVWLLVALLPASFSITGLWLFFKRTRRNKPLQARNKRMT